MSHVLYMHIIFSLLLGFSFDCNGPFFFEQSYNETNKGEFGRVNGPMTVGTLIPHLYVYASAISLKKLHY